MTHPLRRVRRLRRRLVQQLVRQEIQRRKYPVYRWYSYTERAHWQFCFEHSMEVLGHIPCPRCVAAQEAIVGLAAPNTASAVAEGVAKLCG